MKQFHVEENYSPRFWSHCDAIAGVFCLAAFILIVSILSLGGSMESDFSRSVTNYSVSEDILVVGAIITIITFFLLMLPMILLATSTNFTLEEENQLLWILGINPEGEEQKEPEVVQAAQPSKPKDKLGLEEEGKWTFNGTKKPRKFGMEKEGKWTFGQLK